MEETQFFKELSRDAVSIYSPKTLLARLKSGKKLRIKLGADPSRPDLHLGHTVVLRKLRAFQELGHEVVFVIGDFTGMIGDPSGRSKTRPPLSFDETRANAQSYYKQVTRILDREKTLILYNSKWLGQMNFAEVLTLAGKYTLARMLERDDFYNRFSEKQPIGLHELLYPLMQGYDSVALNADIEVGGTDQTFNLLVGRELQRDYGQTPQEVITFPLLPGLDGVQKMSKSLDNYIGINEAPDIMFEKCMRVPDSVLKDYFRLSTDIACSQYEPLIAGDVREAHFAYANEIVTMYHGTQAAISAKARYKTVASGGVPDSAAELVLPPISIGVLDLILAAGFAASKSEARRLVAGGGISINGSIVKDIQAIIPSNNSFALRKGKNNYIKVAFR